MVTKTTKTTKTVLPEEIAGMAKASLRKDNPKEVTAESLGWLKRSDVDDPDTVRWEIPSGQIYSCDRKGPTHMLVRVAGKKQDQLMSVKVL